MTLGGLCTLLQCSLQFMITPMSDQCRGQDDMRLHKFNLALFVGTGWHLMADREAIAPQRVHMPRLQTKLHLRGQQARPQSKRSGACSGLWILPEDGQH